MMEKQRVHLKERGEPVRILLPVALHQILVTNPTRQPVAFSLADGSSQVPTGHGMPFIVPPVQTLAIPFHGAQYANGLQIRATQGELDALLVFEPDMSDFEGIPKPTSNTQELEVLTADDLLPPSDDATDH